MLDTATVKAAVAGEKWAEEKVIEHYTRMIDELAVGEDMKQQYYFETAGRTAKLPDRASIRKRVPDAEPSSRRVRRFTF